LVVIEGNDHFIRAAEGLEEHRIRREGTARGNPLLPGIFNSRPDLIVLFCTQDAPFARMRIQPGNQELPDAGFRPAQAVI